MFGLPIQVKQKIQTNLPKKSRRSKHIREFLYIVSLAANFCLIVSIISYDPSDPSAFHLLSEPIPNISNYFGISGAYISDWIIQLFGICSAFISIFFMIQLLYSFRYQQENTNLNIKIFGNFQFIIFSITLAQALKQSLIFKGTTIFTGGIIGNKIFDIVFFLLGQTGTIIFLTFGTLSSLTLCFGIQPNQTIAWLSKIMRLKFASNFINNISDDLTPMTKDIKINNFKTKQTYIKALGSNSDQNVFFDLLSSFKSNQAWSLKLILQSRTYQNINYELPLICGMLPAQIPYIIDLSTLPNLFIMGPGKQKKEIINILMISLLFQRSPTEMKFILIDPHLCDLPAYDGLGHLLFPILTSPHKSVKAFLWLHEEVENRYSILKKTKSTSFKELQKHHKVPYILMVISEFKELMQAVPYAVEINLQKILHHAHLVGVHLIFATSSSTFSILPPIIQTFFSNRLEKLDNSWLYMNNYKDQYIQTRDIDVSPDEVRNVTQKLKALFPFEKFSIGQNNA